MTTTTIQESGMTFGPFDTLKFFEIEKSSAYSRIKFGVKIAEFALIRDDRNPPEIWVVEAKSSAPRRTGDGRAFERFIGEIQEKLLNGLTMVVAACLKRPNS